jgi:cytochrome P450
MASRCQTFSWHVVLLSEKEENLPFLHKESFSCGFKVLVFKQGKYNARHRKLCQPAFHNLEILERFAETISLRTLKLVDIWREPAGQYGGFTCDIALQTQRLTLDVIGLTSFSHDFEQVEQIRR